VEELRRKGKRMKEQTQENKEHAEAECTLT
jgi:hypothetical protein